MTKDQAAVGTTVVHRVFRHWGDGLVQATRTGDQLNALVEWSGATTFDYPCWVDLEDLEVKGRETPRRDPHADGLPHPVPPLGGGAGAGHPADRQPGVPDRPEGPGGVVREGAGGEPDVGAAGGVKKDTKGEVTAGENARRETRNASATHHRTGVGPGEGGQYPQDRRLQPPDHPDGARAMEAQRKADEMDKPVLPPKGPRASPYQYKLLTLPYAYQIKGPRLIHRFNGRALLGDDMGLGKTIQSLMVAVRHPEDYFPIVVVCPANLKQNWEREALVHFGMRGEVLSGTKPPPGALRKPAPLTIVNYTILKPWMKLLEALPKKLVIVDECQAIANRTTLQAKMVRRLCHEVPKVIALSGTPFTNNPAGLFNVLNLLRPDLFPSFFSYAKQYCLPKEAPVLMGDFSEKPIGDVQIGDTVIGWKTEDGGRRKLVQVRVLDTIKKQSTLQEITLESGKKIVCTPDHKWATGSSHLDHLYREARTGRLGGGGRGCASRVMQVFRGTNPLYSEKDPDYRLGYINGAWRGDGHCVRQYTTKIHPFKSKKRIMKSEYRVGFACKDQEIVQRLSLYLAEFDIPHTTSQREDGLYQIQGVANKRTYTFLTRSRRNSDAWWAGFLGGLYDTEGTGRTIAQDYKMNNKTHRLIQKTLVRFSFGVTTSPKGVRFTGGRAALLRFWNIANPCLRRKLVSFMLSNGGRFNSGGVSSGRAPFVTDIRPLPGTHTTYTLTTETGNYVAYGHGSKNCDPKLAPWGWEYKGATNLDKLHRTLTDNLMIRRRKADVLKDLPAKRRNVIPVELPDRKEYDHALKDFIGWLSRWDPIRASRAVRAEALTKVGYLKRLVGRLKLPFVQDWIDSFLRESEGKLVVFGVHEGVVRGLFKRYQKLAVVLDGQVAEAQRDPVVVRFQQDPKTRLFFGNITAAGKGINLFSASTTLFAEMGWTSVEHDQAEARTNRIGQRSFTEFYYPIAQNTIEEQVVRVVQEKRDVAHQVMDGGDGGGPNQSLNQLISRIQEANRS